MNKKALTEADIRVRFITLALAGAVGNKKPPVSCDPQKWISLVALILEECRHSSVTPLGNVVWNAGSNNSCNSSQV